MGEFAPEAFELPPTDIPCHVCVLLVVNLRPENTLIRLTVPIGVGGYFDTTRHPIVVFNFAAPSPPLST